MYFANCIKDNLPSLNARWARSQYLSDRVCGLSDSLGLRKVAQALAALRYLFVCSFLILSMLATRHRTASKDTSYSLAKSSSSSKVILPFSDIIALIFSAKSSGISSVLAKESASFSSLSLGSLFLTLQMLQVRRWNNSWARS